MNELIELAAALKFLLFTVRNALIVGSVWSFIVIVGHIIPNAWHRNYKLHVVPAIDLAACNVAVWVSGLQPMSMDGEVAGIDGHEVGWRIALGMILTLATWLIPVLIMWQVEKRLPEKVAKSIRKVLL